MSRFGTLALAGLTATGMALASLPAAQAAPLPALSGAQVGGPAAGVEKVQWGGYGRGGYGRGFYGGRGYGRGFYGGRGYGRGYGYRRGIGAGGALAAGAALGLIGGAIAASAAPRYGYYDDGYARPVYGYPAYGYGYPAYGYGYGY